ncbi:MAG TPA: sodium:solute symporter family protein [Thermoanaerobaculia bacterium]|nr:sodium:solute symporter family protein [Thermoanaerobaculia bacterium]
MIIFVIALYLTAVLVIGGFSHRLFHGTSEDFFVATRSLGPALLLLNLFGANMTAFAVLGASGEAYTTGIGVFALMASSSALVIPLVFYFVGTRVWEIGKRRGYVSPIEFFRERYQSDGLGLLLFVVVTGLLIPYLLIGLGGGGIALAQITHGLIPKWLGSLIIVAVVLSYVAYGGMRGAILVNAFQALLLLVLGGISCWVIVHQLGGLESAMTRVGATHPDLLARAGHIRPLQLLTYTFIPLSVGMFPHIFIQWLTARSARAFRLPVAVYPLCIAVVWVPTVVLGVLSRIDFPRLPPAAANSLLVRIVEHHAPGVLVGLLAATLLSAIMNSFDHQVLAVSTMFTQDIVHHYGYRDRLSERQRVWVGRLFVIGVLFVTYLLSLVFDPSLFKLGVWCFTAFAALFPVLLAALFWRRSTKQGIAAAVLSVVALWSYLVVAGWRSPDYTLGGTGILPVALLLAVSAAALVVVSLLTRPPDAATLALFFPAAPGPGEEGTPPVAPGVVGAPAAAPPLAGGHPRRDRPGPA